MSHFTVLCRVTPEQIEAAGSLEKALEKLLEPYDESPDDRNSPYLEWSDETEAMIKKHGSVEAAFKAHNEKYKDDEGGKYVYSTVQSWIDDWHGYRPIPDKPGHFGYQHNPNAKWDWWSIGGRWQGLLPVKPGATNTNNGRPGAFGPQKQDPNTTSACQLKDLNTDLLGSELEQKIKADYLEYQVFWTAFNLEKYAALPVEQLYRERSPNFPSIFTKEGTLKVIDMLFDAYTGSLEHEERFRRCVIDTLVYLYYTSTNIIEARLQRMLDERAEKELREEHKERWQKKHSPWRGGFLLGLVDNGFAKLVEMEKVKEDLETVRQDYAAMVPWNEHYVVGIYQQVDEEEFTIQVKPHHGHLTYAALDEHGEWHAKGKMGWFGCGTDDACSTRVFGETYIDKFLTGDPETWVVVVDCHI